MSEQEDEILRPSEGMTTEEINDILDGELDRVFQNPAQALAIHEVSRITTGFDPIDLAHAVTRLPLKARWIVYDNLPDIEAKIIFITHTGSNTRAAIFRQLCDEEIRKLIEEMPSDEAVDVLEGVAERRIKRILESLDPKKAKRIKELQSHGILTAGRMMTNEFFAFPVTATVGQVREQIRSNPGIDLTTKVFVLDETSELVGYVPDRSLIVNSSDKPLQQLICPVQHKVYADTSRDEVIEIVERYSVFDLPVVDQRDRLLGVVAYEDVVEAMRDAADQTIASFAGTAEDISEDVPTWNRILLRCPWLIVTLCAGVTTSTIMTNFKGAHWFELAPYFVPLIAMMSGNVGIQCSTILVRLMSQGDLSTESKKEAMRNELIVGSSLGLFFAFFSSILIYFLTQLGIYPLSIDPSILTLMVACGIFVACCSATVLGTLSPVLFDKVNIDPAVASGPIVAAFNDLLSTTLFIVVAYSIYAMMV